MVAVVMMVGMVMMMILLVMVGMVMLLLPVYGHRHMRPCNAAGGALYRLQVHAGQAQPVHFFQESVPVIQKLVEGLP